MCGWWPISDGSESPGLCSVLTSRGCEVTQDIRFGGHSVVQLVICSGFCMDVEIFYDV
jgi:hypothetical protein